jgi:hypothetical protein
MSGRKSRRLTSAEKRALASAGLTVVRYQPDGERAEIRQLAPESDQRQRSFARSLSRDTGDMPATEEA